MSPKVKQSKLLVYIASTVAITLWGMSYIWTDKIIAQDIPIFYFVFVRILLAGIILFLFNTAYGRIKRIQKQDLPKFLLLAFFEPFIYFLCETFGLKLTGSPTLSAMVIATIPIFSIGAGILFFKEKVNAVNIGGILLSLVGIVMVAMAKGEPGQHFIWGIILLLTAVIHITLVRTMSLSPTWYLTALRWAAALTEACLPMQAASSSRRPLQQHSMLLLRNLRYLKALMPLRSISILTEAGSGLMLSEENGRALDRSR